jgi:hypothetical protein
MMKFRSILTICLTLGLLLTVSCKKTNSNTNSNNANNASTQPVDLQSAVIKPSEALPPPTPPINNKTAQGVYDFLKTKGWEIMEPRQDGVRYFRAEETAGFRNKENIGFVVLRYADAAKTQEVFPQLNKIYQARWGRAIAAQNFIIGVFGVQKGLNDPKVVQLSDSDYDRLQKDLNEYVQ